MARKKVNAFSLLTRRFKKSEDGAAAIEFGMLMIPFILIVGATIETLVAMAGETLLMSSVDSVSREMRTGNVTFNMGRATDITKADLRAKVCDKISFLMKCKAEGSTDQKLFIDVTTVSTYADIQTKIPKLSGDRFSDLNTGAFQFNPGGPSTINVVRVYYKWSVITDLMRPYISNVRPASGESYYLMVATTAFKNEGF